MNQRAPFTAGRLRFTDHTSREENGETWQCKKARSPDVSDGTERDGDVLNGGRCCRFQAVADECDSMTHCPEDPTSDKMLVRHMKLYDFEVVQDLMSHCIAE